MALDSKLISIGEQLVVKIESSYSGRFHFDSFSDNLLGLTEDRNVYREFRYSKEGLLYTKWVELSNSNLSSIEENVDRVLFIEVRYTRIGTDSTGEIEFVDITFNGVTEPYRISPTISASIFSEIIDSDDQINAENNLFKKLYFRGVIPEYIKRGDEKDLNEDRNYYSLFSSIAKFFSTLLVFIKQFQDFKDNESNLREYLRANNITFDESKTSIEDLQYLTRNLYDEIRKRGTDMIFTRKGQILDSGDVVPVDGEFLRIFKNNPIDEFVYEILPPQKLGWNLGNSSPCWRGTSESLLINKTGENSKDFQDLSKFLTFGKNVDLYSHNNKNVIWLRAEGDSTVLGIGRENEFVDPSGYLIPIDTGLDYEIIFSFWRPYNNQTGELEFKVEGFNDSSVRQPNAFIKQDGSSFSENFIQIDVNDNTFKTGMWYRIRGIIHAYDSKTVEGVKTNIGRGNNLIFSNRNVKYILPTIKVSGYPFSCYLWDYKVRPLVRGKTIAINKSTNRDNSHSLCFLTLRNMLYVYVKNNNVNNSEDEIVEFIDKFLINYNMIKTIQIL